MKLPRVGINAFFVDTDVTYFLPKALKSSSHLIFGTVDIVIQS